MCVSYTCMPFRAWTYAVGRDRARGIAVGGAARPLAQRPQACTNCTICPAWRAPDKPRHFAAALQLDQGGNAADAEARGGARVVVAVHLDQQGLALQGAAAWANCGAICWHGPHQGAQKSTTTGRSVAATTLSKLASPSSSGCPSSNALATAAAHRVFTQTLRGHAVGGAAFWAGDVGAIAVHVGHMGAQAAVSRQFVARLRASVALHGRQDQDGQQIIRRCIPGRFRSPPPHPHCARRARHRVDCILRHEPAAGGVAPAVRGHGAGLCLAACRWR